MVASSTNFIALATWRIRNEKPRSSGVFLSYLQELRLRSDGSRCKQRSYNRLLNHVDKLAVFRPFPREFDLAVFFRE